MICSRHGLDCPGRTSGVEPACLKGRPAPESAHVSRSVCGATLPRACEWERWRGGVALPAATAVTGAKSSVGQPGDLAESTTACLRAGHKKVRERGVEPILERGGMGLTRPGVQFRRRWHRRVGQIWGRIHVVTSTAKVGRDLLLNGGPDIDLRDRLPPRPRLRPLQGADEESCTSRGNRFTH